MSDEYGRNADGTFVPGTRGVFADQRTQAAAGVSHLDSELGAQIKIGFYQQAKHGPGGLAAAGTALGEVAQAIDWKDPYQVVAFLAAVGLLFFWIALAGPLAPFFWALTLAVVVLPMLAYVQAIRAANALGGGQRARFGFRGSFSLAMGCFIVYTLLVDLLCWVTDRGFPGFDSLIYVAIGGPWGRFYGHSRIEMGIAGLVALPFCVLLRSWFARRLAKGKRAMPWYLKVAGAIVLLPLVLPAAGTLLGLFYHHHRELAMQTVTALARLQKSLGLN
jgi:hypothetical protein